MNSLRNKLLLFVVALFTLSGCSLLQTPEPLAEEAWSFKGKMAIRNDVEASSFNVYWLQQGEVFQIELSGPLGQGEVRISGQPGDVTLTQGKKEVKAISLSDLAYEITSMDLPLDHLQFWVRAEPSPFEQYILTENEAGLVEAIEQSGWRVSITDYFDDESESPRKLSFAKASETGKLIIREWNGL